MLPAGLTLGHAGGFVVAINGAGAHGSAGCGGFHRKGPSGGFANGIPRNAHEPPRSTPCTSPLAVATRQDVACELAADDEATSAADARPMATTAALTVLVATPFVRSFVMTVSLVEAGVRDYVNLRQRVLPESS
jgi:hypothetical protein